ncbi:hypothetical protein B0I35DRAFT_404332 [Stachybotrys elegans]|uniref:Uncharacterized protein n=1 Tax=Stachybotrys elegans TaxID=80388 RepID=A0A8K0T2L7_9HYPO|nr:hypothetical protein B0I35DRAFT_404332 [Stachybotrys elegans]
MPAMWDRLRSTTPDFLPHKHRIVPFNKGGLHLHLDGHIDSRDKTDWQSDFDNLLYTLSQSDAPHRYEVRRGKTVPRPPQDKSGQVSPSTDSSESEEAGDEDNDLQPPSSVHRRPQLPPKNSKAESLAPSQPSQQPPPLSAPRHFQFPAWSDPDRLSPTSSSSEIDGEMYGQGVLEQISPPSSPDLNARDGYTHEVSPIDDDDEFYWTGQRRMQPQGHAAALSPRNATSPTSTGKSSIPTMRRDRRKNLEAAAAANREAKSKDRVRDKRQATHPQVSRGGGVRLNAPSGSASVDSWMQDREYGVTTTVSTGAPPLRAGDSQPTFGQRVRQQLARSKPDPLETRPPWQGASGRTSLLQPLRDNLAVAPLSVSPRLNKSAGRSGDPPFSASVSPVSPHDSETAGGPVAALRRFLPSGSAGMKPSHTNSDPTAQTSKVAALSYPSPPYVESPVSLSPTSGHPNASPTTLSATGSVLANAEASKAIKRKPPPSITAVAAPAPVAGPKHAVHPSISSSVYSAHPEPSAPAVPSTDVAVPQEQWLQPPSRFSVTTYATSSADADSARLSGEEEHPPLPPAPQQLVSVLDRTRPIPPENQKINPTAPIVISMQTTYTESPTAIHEHEKPATTTELCHTVADPNSDEPAISIMSTSKALPPAPPELSAADRVGQLNARLESLAYRRVNITRSIKQMTELMPTDNLLASAEVLRRRESEKLKVEQLKEELAEVQREEYDLGLKLHLAYKRLERDSEFESSSLWVRRVTG